MSENILLILFSAFSVFPLWILEQFVPYPFIVEELTKFFLVFWLFRKQPRNVFWTILLSSVAFGLSEAVLYQIKVLQLQNTLLLPLRLLFTLPMHTLTYFILYWGTRKNVAMSIITLLTSFLIHYLFNLGLSSSTVFP